MSGGKLIYEGGMAGSGGEGVTATIHGNIEIKGNVHATGSICLMAKTPATTPTD